MRIGDRQGLVPLPMPITRATHCISKHTTATTEPMVAPIEPTMALSIKPTTAPIDPTKAHIIKPTTTPTAYTIEPTLLGCMVIAHAKGSTR